MILGKILLWIIKLTLTCLPVMMEISSALIQKVNTNKSRMKDIYHPKIDVFEIPSFDNNLENNPILPNFFEISNI